MADTKALAETFDDSDIDELAALYKKIAGPLGRDSKTFMTEAATGLVAMEGATDGPIISAARTGAISLAVDEASEPLT